MWNGLLCAAAVVCVAAIVIKASKKTLGFIALVGIIILIVVYGLPKLGLGG